MRGSAIPERNKLAILSIQSQLVALPVSARRIQHARPLLSWKRRTRSRKSCSKNIKLCKGLKVRRPGALGGLPVNLGMKLRSSLAMSRMEKLRSQAQFHVSA